MDEKIPLLEFPIEEIPNQDTLYCRVHTVNIDYEEPDSKKRIRLIAFDPHPKGSTQMSTDWNKYSTPLKLQQLAKCQKRMELSLLMLAKCGKRLTLCTLFMIQSVPKILKIKHIRSF